MCVEKVGICILRATKCERGRRKPVTGFKSPSSNISAAFQHTILSLFHSIMYSSWVQEVRIGKRKWCNSRDCMRYCMKLPWNLWNNTLKTLSYWSLRCFTRCSLRGAKTSSSLWSDPHCALHIFNQQKISFRNVFVFFLAKLKSNWQNISFIPNVCLSEHMPTHSVFEEENLNGFHYLLDTWTLKNKGSDSKRLTGCIWSKLHSFKNPQGFFGFFIIIATVRFFSQEEHFRMVHSTFFYACTLILRYNAVLFSTKLVHL